MTRKADPYSTIIFVLLQILLILNRFFDASDSVLHIDGVRLQRLNLVVQILEAPPVQLHAVRQPLLTTHVLPLPAACPGWEKVDRATGAAIFKNTFGARAYHRFRLVECLPQPLR